MITVNKVQYKMYYKINNDKAFQSNFKQSDFKSQFILAVNNTEWKKDRKEWKWSLNTWVVSYFCSFQPSTPTKVVFAEWVAGMRPPDPQTINKHVHDMVEVRLIQCLIIQSACMKKIATTVQLTKTLSQSLEFQSKFTELYWSMEGWAVHNRSGLKP